jgi:hypothetical protein
MIDRLLLWLSAGVITAGVPLAMIAGAGVAVADDGTTSGSGTGSSSDSSNSTENKQDSDKQGPKPGKNGDKKQTPASDEPSAKPTDDDEDTSTPAKDQDATGEPAAEPSSTDEDAAKKGSDHDAAESATHKTSDPPDKPAAPAADIKKAVDNDEAKNAVVVETKDADVPAPTAEATVPPANKAGPVDEAVAAAKAKQTPVEATLAFAAVEPAATPTGPTLLNIVGTFFWGLFDLVSKALDFPPTVPPGSTVTAGRSTLQIDCGDGYTADADWYFPTEGEPDKFIYFQHGFPGRAGFYNLTLAELAERNNAVVVAPSITGNFFACDGCNLTSDPMHAAVARLFEGDRAALLASAQAAGYEGALPEQFVISGQSAGGILAAGTAGYFEEFAPADEKSNMVGVLLFDTSASGGVLARALDKLPASLPVLHIAAAPAPLNTYGNANQVLVAKRPGQFNGVQLVGGTHADAFRSSALFGIPQFVVGLVTGPSTPENVEAVHVLAEGWITDMYAGRVYDPATRTGIYGDPGEPGEVVIDIPTDAGVAHGYVLPGPTPQLTLVDLILRTFLELPAAFNFASCAADPSASPLLQANPELTENSTPNTVLSLDGKGSTGHSVGQHVCTG